MLIDTTVVGLFGLVAVATAHEHWLKERDDVIPITGPLKAWVDQLDSKTLKRLERNLAPTLFVVGCATVIGPDVVLEMRERARNRQTVSRPQKVGLRFPYATSGHNEVSPDGPRGNGSAGGWSGSIPTAPDLGTELDV